MSTLLNGSISDQSSADCFCEVTIDVPWGHISGKWWGPKTVQPVLAIHGWLDNAGSFDKLAPILEENGIPVLCIDMPGHGLSSHFPRGMYYQHYWDGVLLIRRIVKHFNWSNITLLGHSLGGSIAFLYAATYPEDIEKLICIDVAGPFVQNTSKMAEKCGYSIDKLLKYCNINSDSIPRYKYDEMVDLAMNSYNGSVTRESCEILLKRGIKPSEQDGTYTFSRDVRLKLGMFGFTSINEVLLFASRIVRPVLNIRADPGEPLNKEHYALVMHKLNENAVLEYHVVKGAHHLHLNDADSVAGIITHFLKK